ncbi:MAG: DUF6259 domain-containing protein [Candidatus Latescibacterota bacterium]
MKTFSASVHTIAASILAISLFLTAPSVAAPGFWAYAAETTTLTETNSRLMLTFGSPDSGFPLDSIYDTKERRTMSKPGLPLWSVELQHSSGKKLALTSTRCGRGDIDRQGPSLMTLTWSLDEVLERTVPAGKDSPAQQLRAVCSIQTVGNRALMKLRLYNHTTTWSIRSVVFPSLELVQLGVSDENDAFVFPFAAGKIVRQPLKKAFSFGGEQANPSKDRTGRYANPWTTMQFCSYWDDRGGLYIAAEDPLASVKYINAQPSPDKSSLHVSVTWPAENTGVPGNDFEHPGSIAIELFDGDWFDAAKIYRRWVMREARWWPSMGSEGRVDTPKWMKENAVWVITSLSAESIDKTIKFADFMKVPTAVHLYNWHQIPFDNQYPHYFPAKSGFREGITKLHKAGIRVMPYINARLWDKDTEDFPTVALPAATKMEGGGYYIETYGSPVELVPMCPTTDLWTNTMKTLVMNLVSPEIDVDGVYLDQVSAMSPALCFDPSHGHPLGGGHWWTVDGYWPMIEGIQKNLAAKFPDKMLTSECNAEPYIHCFDGYLTWHYEFNDMVPLFSAVYGGAIQQFGRAYSGNDKAAHLMRIGQSLVFGEQLGWIDPGIIDQKETAEFLRDASQLRHRLVPFLSEGEMMRPPELIGNIPQITTEWAWAEEEKKVTDSAVQRGAWRSPDGRVAFIFANITGEKASFTWQIDPLRYGFGKESLNVETVGGAAGNLTIKTVKKIPVTLAGREITAYIVSPAGK